MSENTTPNLQPEVSLPIAPTIGEIDHFRIINKNGQSQKATITQVRELMGMDYSILTEQIVHGEYWFGVNGNRKQLFSQSFAGKLPTPNLSNVLTRLVFKSMDAILRATGFYINQYGDRSFFSIYVDATGTAVTYIDFPTPEAATTCIGHNFFANILYTK